MVNYTQWRSLVDGSELPAIPDSVVALYQPSEESSTGTITTIQDREVSTAYPLSGSCSVINNGINGNMSFRFDGSETVSNTDFSLTNERLAVVCAVEKQSSAGSGNYFFGSNSNSDEFGLQDNITGGNAGYQMRRGGSRGSNITSLPLDQNSHVIVLEGLNTSDMRLEVDGQSFKETLSSGGISEFVLSGGGGTSMQADFGDVSILDGATESEIISERDRIADKFGIAI